MTNKDVVIDLFKKFVEKLAHVESYTSYTDLSLEVDGDRFICTANGVDSEAKDEPYVLTVVYRKGSGNVFYYRNYAGTQQHTQSVRAKGDEDLKSVLTKLLKKVKEM